MASKDIAKKNYLMLICVYIYIILYYLMTDLLLNIKA